MGSGRSDLTGPFYPPNCLEQREGSQSKMRKFLCCIILITSMLLPTFDCQICLAGGGPRNVLLVINDNSATSQAIGAYYQQKRGIPDRNVCHIRCSVAEQVTRAECETNIVSPIRAFLAAYDVTGQIDYIVLTKGIPLKADYSNTYFDGPLSVNSVLTCVGEPSITYPYPVSSDPAFRPPLVNPYGPTATPAAPEQYFTHGLSFSGHRYYAVTRLDAYAVTDIFRMIDDACAAQPAQGLFLIDGAELGATYAHLNDRLRQTNNALIAKGYQTYYTSADFDTRLREFVGGQQGVMGYFSWGSNEAYSFTHAAYVSNHFLPGSIADTLVSYSGRTFTYPPSAGQSLIADLIPQGLSGGNGSVSEPNANLATYPGVLFDRYLKGYNFAESFLAATPELYWKAATVGDPLMAPYATPPVVTFTDPQGNPPLHGVIHVFVNATDASGVQKVEFYIDDEPVAVCTSAPYEFDWDTSGYPDGTYTIEAIAWEDSPVYTQGAARIQARVLNTPQDVSRIGDLSGTEEGGLVRLTSKIVTAAFNDCIYVSELDRAAGVKVTGTTAAQPGELVDIEGERRLVDGQQVIQGTYLAHVGTGEVPMPIGLINRDLGNRGKYSGPGSSSLRVGLSSIGLLVRTWGQVQQLATGAFYIADRSIKLPTGATGRLKVSFAGMKETPSMPAFGGWVEVTGISALEPDGADLKPVLRPRTPSDIEYNLLFTQLSTSPGMVVPGWNLLSIPGISTNPTAAAALPGIDLEGKLHAWDPLTQSMCTYSAWMPEAFPPLCVGIGFWLQVVQPYNIVTRVISDDPDTDMWISLPVAGYTIVGHPFTSPRRVNGCHITDGLEMLSVAEAAARGWLDGGIFFWESSAAALCYIDAQWDDNAEFSPWHGYWVQSLKPNLALIVSYAQS